LNALYKTALDSDKDTEPDRVTDGGTETDKDVGPSENEHLKTGPSQRIARIFVELPKDALKRLKVENADPTQEGIYEVQVSCDDTCEDLEGRANEIAEQLGGRITYLDADTSGSDKVRSLLAGQSGERIKLRRKTSTSFKGMENAILKGSLNLLVSCEGSCKDEKAVTGAISELLGETDLPLSESSPPGDALPALRSLDGRDKTVKTAKETKAIPPKIALGKYYGLVVGINKYMHINKLENAVNDAVTVDKVLKDDYGFENRVLLEDQATRDNIMKALNDLRKQLTENDSLLVYFSGHGEYNKESDTSYWLPVDADYDDNTNWVESKSVSDQLKLIAAKHILVVADSCFSGTLTREINSSLSKNSTREIYLNKIFDKPSRVLIASGGNEPVTDAGGKGHSIFADVFITALKNPFDKTFTAEELMTHHLKESVAGRTEQTPEYKVIRNSGHDGGDFVFVKRQ